MKYLVADAAGFDPIRYSINKGWMMVNDFGKFFCQVEIKMCIPDIALKEGEFSYSEIPCLFNSYTVTSTVVNDQTYIISSNGTVLPDNIFLNESKFKIYSINTKSSQPNLWQTSEYWPELSLVDKSNIFLAEDLLNSKKETAILTNDLDLKFQSIISNIPVFGTASLLAGMVIGNIYSHQKGTKLFYNWQIIDPKWTPKGYTFREVLDSEKLREQKGQSFWLN